MLLFLGRRILLAVPTLLIISIVSFLIIQLPPGDFVTVAAAREQGSFLDEEEVAAMRAGGEEGEAPPEDLQADVERLWEIVNEFQPEADAAVREGMLQDVYDINLNHLWTIGGMNQNPDLTFNPYNNNLRNVVGKTFAWQAHVPGGWFYAQ